MTGAHGCADALALAVLDAEDAHAAVRSAGTGEALAAARTALAAVLPSPSPEARTLVQLLGVVVELVHEPGALHGDPGFQAVVTLAGRALLGLVEGEGDDQREAGTAAAVQLAAIVAGYGGASPGFDLDP